MNVPIEDSIDLSESYPSVVDRYFTKRSPTDQEDEVCLLMHSNKICVVTLAKSHAIFQKKIAIRKVNFKIGEKLDRMSNTVKGKGKKGAQHVDMNSVLCIIECEDDSEFHVKACVKGKLIEVNKNLVSKPQLLLDFPETDGYIAVVLMKLGELKLDE